MSLSEILGSFLNNQHSRNKIYESELKHGETKSSNKNEDIEKMYTDAFLPRWLDNDLKKLDQEISDQTNIDENKKWLGKQNAPHATLDDPVTVFGKSVKDTTDADARNLVEKQLIDARNCIKTLFEAIPHAHFWDKFGSDSDTEKIWDNFGAYKRCQAVAKRLNDVNPYNDCSFVCASRDRTRFENDNNLNYDGVTTLSFRRHIK